MEDLYLCNSCSLVEDVAFFLAFTISEDGIKPKLLCPECESDTVFRMNSRPLISHSNPNLDLGGES